MRYRLIIEYDGAEFCGWQSQADGRAVQDALQEAIKSFCGETVTVYGAGRTDSGVHARGQVGHIDLESAPKPDRVRDGINFYLRPSPVAVREAFYARADFDARFSALARHYRYRIISQRAPVVLARDQAWWVPQPLDVRRCGKPVNICSESTIFRHFGPVSARPIRLCVRSMCWMCRAVMTA